jgi:segregation and condensation protein A
MAVPNISHECPQPTVRINELLAAYREVLSRFDMYEHYHVSREKLSTRERMSDILTCLQGQKFVDFYTLFRLTEGRVGVVVTFLAMMELLKEQLVHIVQVQDYGAIHITLLTDHGKEYHTAKGLQETGYDC